MDADHNVDLMWINMFNMQRYGKKGKLVNFNLIVKTMMYVYSYLTNTCLKNAMHQI